ncbi:MAG: flagellar hook-basal body complex protein FliE [Candidatus Eremiobacteraeota bacterium]|nr:flagellar hook-basal body complex protein FliE [Candidatus Eremiobacteraeota bacterium]
MTVEPIVPDAPISPDVRNDRPNDGDVALFSRALDALGSALTGATRAEDEFAYGRGTLQAAVYERAQADVALSVAVATAQRAAQAVQSVFNMQV